MKICDYKKRRFNSKKPNNISDTNSNRLTATKTAPTAADTPQLNIEERRRTPRVFNSLTTPFTKGHAICVEFFSVGHVTNKIHAGKGHGVRV